MNGCSPHLSAVDGAVTVHLCDHRSEAGLHRLLGSIFFFWALVLIGGMQGVVVLLALASGVFGGGTVAVRLAFVFRLSSQLLLRGSQWTLAQETPSLYTTEW